VEVVMPRLSDQMGEGTVLRWVKEIGDDVVLGDELFEIETDKATWIVEAEADGVLLRILVDEGGMAPVGGVVALVGDRDEVGEEIPTTEPARLARLVDAQSAAAPASAAPPPPNGRPRATPVARRTAAESGVSLASLSGSGPGGRIVRSDVLAAAQGAPAAGTGRPSSGRGPGAAVTLTATQQTIARRMVESTTTVPHFFTTVEIDMEAAVALRADLKELTPESIPSLNDLVVRASALALREFPNVNASWSDGTIIHWPRINIGVAVAIPDALLVPVVVDADCKSLAQIASETSALARRAHDRALTPEELANGTFTVSNLGMLGVSSFSAVVNVPEAAILAVGAVTRAPAVDRHGAVVARHRMQATLSADHRVIYGAEGARFLARIRELLERPLALTLWTGRDARD
jgi:pyruvate dehydrogenase E2 component (dihydrolipoamide acetyltransferase)